jgi:hypothetical protein
MPAGLKVRLDDGSEVGPLDLAMVKSWYEQGLINADSAVQRAGSKTWTKLAQAVDLRTWGGFAHGAKSKAVRRPPTKGSAASTARGSARDDEVAYGAPAWTEHWGTTVAGVLLAIAAAAAAYLWWRPHEARSPLDAGPWWAIALGFLAAALALLPGWELSRKLVRVAAVILAVAVFPLLGLLFAQGVRGGALLAVGGALVFLLGLFAFTSEPAPHWTRAAASLLVVLAGAGAAGYFAYAPETDDQKRVREAVGPERGWSDPSLGVTLALPAGWHVLKKDNPVFTQPAEAKVAFAHPRLEAFGYLEADSSPAGIDGVDAWLDSVLAERKKGVASFKEEARAEAAVGTLVGRRATASWSSAGARYSEQVTAWKDGWVYYALVAWAPEGTGAADLEALASGASSRGDLATRLQQAVQAATLEVPVLTPAAAELLMARSEAKMLEPDQAFRRSFDAVASALSAWNRNDSQELGKLIASCYQGLTGRDRTRLAAYVEKVRAHQLTSPQEDREMQQLMKSAVLRLPAGRRLRLQALFERAVQEAASRG